MSNITASNGDEGGNDAQDGQVSSLTVGEHLANLEERFRQTEQRQEELEGDIRFVKGELGSRLVGLESRFANFEAANIDKQLLTIRQDIMKFKTALAAFSNHIHLPDGRLGMPFTLKG